MKYIVGTLCAASVALLTLIVWLSIGLSSRVAELESANRSLRVEFVATLAKYTAVLDIVERRQTRVENSLWDSSSVMEVHRLAKAYNQHAKPRAYPTRRSKRRAKERSGIGGVAE